MHSAIVKKALLFISILIVGTMACDLSVTLAPSTGPVPVPTNTMGPASESSTPLPASATSLPSMVAPNATPTTLQISSEGVEVFYGSLRLVLPPGLASGAAIGLGIMTKYTIWVAGLIVAVLITSARKYLRSKWLYLGAGLALLIFLSNLISPLASKVHTRRHSLDPVNSVAR